MKDGKCTLKALQIGVFGFKFRPVLVEIYPTCGFEIPSCGGKRGVTPLSLMEA